MLFTAEKPNNLKGTDDYLRHLLRFRISLNDKLTVRVRQIFTNRFFAGEILKRIEKGRKIRSFLFIRTAEGLHPNLPENDLLDICLSIEMSHAASVLVDDILDGDDVRHGCQSSQASLGTPAATLQAHYLCSEAIAIVRHWPKIQNLLIDTYRRLAIGEMYDIFMPQPIDKWVRDGYTEQIYQKTSALFEYCVVSAGLFVGKDNLRGPLKLVGQTIGKLYQISNDYYDLQPYNIRKRHTTDHSWRITFSFPLAIYLQLNGPSAIQKELKQQTLDYNQWVEFLKKIWTREVQSLTLNALTQTEKDVEKLVAQMILPDEVRDQFLNLIGFIVQESFWYHDLNAQ